MALAFIIAALVVIIDQVSKLLIVQFGVDNTVVIPGLLNFVYSENDGMAWGLGSGFAWFFVVVTIVVSVFMIYLMTKKDFKSKLYFVAAGLIIGGGLGNMIDRIFRGFVVDFLSLSFFPPICNLADYAITAGTICLIVFIIFYYGKKKESSSEKISSEKES